MIRLVCPVMPSEKDQRKRSTSFSSNGLFLKDWNCRSTCSLPKLMRASQGVLMLGLGRDPRSCNWCVSRDGVVVSLQMNEQIDLSIPPPQLCTVLRWTLKALEMHSRRWGGKKQCMFVTSIQFKAIRLRRDHRHDVLHRCSPVSQLKDTWSDCCYKTCSSSWNHETF